MLKKVIFYLLIIVSVLVIIGTFLSLLHGISNWYLKVLDFARLQFFLLALISLIFFVVLKKSWHLSSAALALGLCSAIVIQGLYLLPYTALGEKTVLSAEATAATQENTVGILIANVWMKNRQSAALLDIIRDTNPDMVLVMETDQWWLDQLEPLIKYYPYTMLHPLDNTYGMGLYSKLPLTDSKIKFLQQPGVPSFHARVQLPSGKKFQFHGVHPVPPVPSKKYPDNSDEKEVALIKVGNLVVQSPLADIVAGDYNDVSWSNTTRLFEAKGGLNNVRLGRGYYNTFDAKSPVFRWPLDHYFVTAEFALLEIERLPDFSSDHFPMYARFVLQE